MEFYRIDPVDAYSYQEEMEWLESQEGEPVPCDEGDGDNWQEFAEWSDRVDEHAVNREQEEAWQEVYAQAYDSLGY